jgi:hypothetical protein
VSLSVHTDSQVHIQILIHCIYIAYALHIHYIYNENNSPPLSLKHVAMHERAQVRGLKRRLSKVDGMQALREDTHAAEALDDASHSHTHPSVGRQGVAKEAEMLTAQLERGGAWCSENMSPSPADANQADGAKDIASARGGEERERERRERRPPSKEARARSVVAFGSSMRQAAANGSCLCLCVVVRLWRERRYSLNLGACRRILRLAVSPAASC